MSTTERWSHSFFRCSQCGRAASVTDRKYPGGMERTATCPANCQPPQTIHIKVTR